MSKLISPGGRRPRNPTHQSEHPHHIERGVPRGPREEGADGEAAPDIRERRASR